MKYTIGFAAAALSLTLATSTFAGIDYSTISSNELMESLEKKQSIQIVDIQKKKLFLLHHFFNSLETDAYPVKTSKDTGKLKKILKALQTSTDPVIIVGPRGTRASQRTYAYLTQQGIDPKRLNILEKGVRGWPAPEILLNTSGQ